MGWARGLCGGCLLLSAGCADAPGDEDIGIATSEVLVCADGDTRQGIDVSYYQGSIDWAAVAGDGIDFAIARVNHGDFMDPEFAANWQGARDHGLVRGAYQYFDPGGDPVAQANTFIDEVGRLGPGDLPGVIDVESTDGLSPAEIEANVATWLALVEEATGRQPFIYTGSYFWNDNVVTDAFNDHPLWIAHYTTGCPNVPDAWMRWAMWQYTSTGSVAGIAGNVDRNAFNGDLVALHDMAGAGLRARVVALDYPASLRAGDSGEVTIVLENRGARTWSGETRLGTTMPRDRDSLFQSGGWASPNRVAAMPIDVLPGDQITLTFSITAPADAGQYHEHFNLVEDGFAWFSDTPPGGEPLDDTIALDIVVTDEGDGGEGGQGEGGGVTVAAAGRPHDDGGCAMAPPPARRASHAGWLLAVGLLLTRRRRR